MKDITITITAGDELTIAADSLDLGTQYDNKACTLRFVRPEEYETDLLYLIFQTSRHGMMFAPIGIDVDNAFVVTSLLTQGERLSMQIMLVHAETEIRSNVIVFEIRPSIPSTKAPPLEIPIGGVSMGDIPGLQDALDKTADKAGLDIVETRVNTMFGVLSDMANPDILKVSLLRLPHAELDASSPIEAGTTVYSGFRAWTALVDMENPEVPETENASWAFANDDYLLSVPISAFSMVRVAGHMWYAEINTILTQDIVAAMRDGPFGAGAHVEGFSLLWGWPVEWTPGLFFVSFGGNHAQTWYLVAFEPIKEEETE